MNTTATAHAVALAALVARRRWVGQRLGTFAAVRLAHLVDVLTLLTRHFAGYLPLVQVGLDLAGREIAFVDVLGQISPDEVEKPTLVCRHGTMRLGQLRFDFAGRVI